VLAPLLERMTRMIDETPGHAEPIERLASLLARLDLHMRKLEQLIYPLLRRVDAGEPGAYLLPRLLGADALDLAADAAAIHADLDGLRHLARMCPHAGTIEVARKLDDRARRFLRLESDVLLPRAAQITP
jgi:iron-sulfur cluster repair protein YtfE (RIC family)